MTLKAFKLRGSALIYDSEMQLPNCIHTFLWNIEEESVDEYLTSAIEESILTINNDAELFERYIARYLEWRDKYLTEWLNEKKPYYSARDAESIAELAKQQERARLQKVLKSASDIGGLELAARHMQKVIDSGQRYLGLQRPTLRYRRRITHCYSCKGRLDNSTDVECIACGWILCPCGACGCGYIGL